MSEPPIEPIIAAARAAVDRQSLRAVARQIGMSPTGLKRMLAGTEPYGPTRARLREWHRAFVSGEADAERGRALERLLVDVPAARQGEVRREIERLLAGMEEPAPPPREPHGPIVRCRRPGCGATYPRSEIAAHAGWHREQDLGRIA